MMGIVKKILIGVLIVVGIIGFWVATSGNNMRQVPQNTPVSPQPTSQQVSENFVQVAEAKLRLSVPEGLEFSKQQQMNLTTNQSYAVNFYIQNYKETIAEVEKPYQLYGLYQWDTGETTEEAFRKSDFMFDPETRKEFTVDGKPAISGVSSGDRARYTTYILHNGHVLTLAASETASEQREITDRIIRSITFE